MRLGLFYVDSRHRAHKISGMRLTRTTLFLAIISAGPQLHAEPQNNFASISTLSFDDQTAFGIVRIPDTLIEIGRVRDIPVLAADPGAQAQEHFEAVAEASADLPEIVDLHPPRAIVLPGGGLRLLPSPLATARASGATIILGMGFFKTTGMTGVAVADRPNVLLHEWGHVLQYYFSDLERTGRFDLATHSTLFDDWPDAVGWVMKDGAWELPEDAASGTTAYGRTDPIEDQAESIALVLSGQPQRLSQDRVDFVSQALGIDLAAVSRGVVPVPEGFVPLRRVGSRIGALLDSLVPESEDAQLLIGEDILDPEVTLTAISREMQDRGFTEIDYRFGPSEVGGLSIASGTWTYETTNVQLGAVALPEAESYSVILRLLK